MQILQRPLPDSWQDLSAEMPSVLKRVYARRSVKSIAQLDTGLQRLPEPGSMKGMAAAVAVLVEAIEAGKRIMIIGDFDADGATSTTLAVRALRLMGAADVAFLVPNRFEYGYGLTPEIVAVAARSRPDVIVTVDNGIASIDGVAAARELGIQVVVTDHHLPGRSLPAAQAVVNPNQEGCAFPSKAMAGVGVIFYVMLALRAELQTRDWFARQGITRPNLAKLLDLVALGTVADVVPLDHLNRILVSQGLARIRQGHACAGISALLEIAGRTRSRVVASDMGFAVGPRLNAAGRLQDMSIGIHCLLSDDPQRARELAGELDQLNRERRSIEGEMQQQAMLYLDNMQWGDEADLPRGLCLLHEEWHQGVIGILASRIKERFHRPVIAFAVADENSLKGSARSVPGFHIRDGLDAVATRHPGLIEKFGGHAMAAGLSIKRQDFEAFQQAFAEEVARHLDEKDLQGVVWSDGQLSDEDFSLALAETLRQAGPWGQAFPEPCFDGEFVLLNRRIVGEKHLKMTLQSPSGKVLDGIAFNVTDEDWPVVVERVRLAYKLDVNVFRNQQNLQLLIDFVEPL